MTVHILRLGQPPTRVGWWKWWRSNISLSETWTWPEYDEKIELSNKFIPSLSRELLAGTELCHYGALRLSERLLRLIIARFDFDWNLVYFNSVNSTISQFSIGSYKKKSTKRWNLTLDDFRVVSSDKIKDTSSFIYSQLIVNVHIWSIIGSPDR